MTAVMMRLSKLESVPWFNVGVRTLLATLGAYGLASLTVVALARGFSLPKLDGAMLGVMGGFVVQAVGVIAAFAVHSLWRSVLVIGVPSALLGLYLCF